LKCKDFQETYSEVRPRAMQGAMHSEGHVEELISSTSVAFRKFIDVTESSKSTADRIF